MRALLAPIAAVQGYRLRTTAELAPPAGGPTTGVTGAPPGGSGAPPLRLAVLGDSSAAGCGVDRHEDGFTGSLAAELAARTGRAVQWQVVGRFGATSRRIRHRLLPEVGDGLDLAVLLAGGNDVLSRREPREWHEHLVALVDGLLARAEHVVVTGVPPFRLFPAVPGALGRVLQARADVLDELSRAVCAQRPRTTWITMTETPPPAFFAGDGFHLAAPGYRRWAEVVAASLPASALTGLAGQQD